MALFLALDNDELNKEEEEELEISRIPDLQFRRPPQLLKYAVTLDPFYEDEDVRGELTLMQKVGKKLKMILVSRSETRWQWWVGKSLGWERCQRKNKTDSGRIKLIEEERKSRGPHFLFPSKNVHQPARDICILLQAEGSCRKNNPRAAHLSTALIIAASERKHSP